MCTGLDAAWLKNAFLYGVNLTDDNGDPYPEELWEIAIGMAREVVETEIGTSLCEVRTYDERYDVTYGDWGRAYQTQLNFGPVRTLEAIEFKIADIATVQLPLSWGYIRSSELSIVEIIPGFASPTVLQMTGAGYLVDGRFFDARMPAFLRFVYTAGFNDTTYPIPMLAKQVIGWIASMLPLDTAGDLIAGAGIASFSIGMDGLSQSIGTTSSATNSGYGARILSYQKQLDKYMPILKAKYRGMPFAAL